MKLMLLMEFWLLHTNFLFCSRDLHSLICHPHTMSSLESLSQLDQKSQQELAQWVEAEVSKAKVRSSIHNFTEVCFRKCITTVEAYGLQDTDERCLKNCLGRFLDTNVAIIKAIQQQTR